MLYDALPIKQIPDSLVCGVDSTLITSENSINYQHPTTVHCGSGGGGIGVAVSSDSKDRHRIMAGMSGSAVLGEVPVHNELLINNLNLHNIQHNQNEITNISNYLSSSVIDNYSHSRGNIGKTLDNSITPSLTLTTLKNKVNSTSNNRNHIITDTLPGPESCV